VARAGRQYFSVGWNARPSPATRGRSRRPRLK